VSERVAFDVVATGSPLRTSHIHDEKRLHLQQEPAFYADELWGI
jgi:hypothetical protein